jgi:hypothetical protein
MPAMVAAVRSPTQVLPGWPKRIFLFFSIYILSFPYIFSTNNVSFLSFSSHSHFTIFSLLFSPLIYFSLQRDEQQHKDQENLLDIHDQADTDALSSWLGILYMLNLFSF